MLKRFCFHGRACEVRVGLPGGPSREKRAFWRLSAHMCTVFECDVVFIEGLEGGYGKCEEERGLADNEGSRFPTAGPWKAAAISATIRVYSPPDQLDQHDKAGEFPVTHPLCSDLYSLSGAFLTELLGISSFFVCISRKLDHTEIADSVCRAAALENQWKENTLNLDGP